jgi:hypothetical protein
MLSLNSIISGGLEAHYLKHFNLKLEKFSGQLFAADIQTKGFIAHDTDDTIVLFEERKKLQVLGKMLCSKPAALVIACIVTNYTIKSSAFI